MKKKINFKIFSFDFDIVYILDEVIWKNNDYFYFSESFKQKDLQFCSYFICLRRQIMIANGILLCSQVQQLQQNLIIFLVRRRIVQ